MKKIGSVLVLMLLLSGCATYKFAKGPSPYDKGYVAYYDGKLIPEYTLGQNNSVPELVLAKERFNRRRAKVEYYYKKMGLIEARLKELFWDPPAMCLDFIGGILRWPFIAVADYKYNRNPQYRERVDRLDEQQDEMEKARINGLQAKLKAYIEEDLAKESGKQETSSVEPASSAQHADVAAQDVSEPPAVKSVPVPVEPSKPAVAAYEEPAPVIVKENKEISAASAPAMLEPPVAVIIAKPEKGFSPLQVNFNAGKSYSKSGKIVSYSWDFGDGDTSTKKNALNTYWSTTYGRRIFTATLTVKDDKGQMASVSQEIEVSTK